ncbi:unnamed protein product [Xylocopa violacea]|uniref:HAUS augmin-like complex subunit 6 N-terminal domain-containing protein n=2 Tax=Xylocopa violacea TaxID=135666 RepID=A0ABP1NYY4_XYLVO
MAVSASFHRNVLLLSRVIKPSDEFQKYFREGMFNKPNTAGFLHISHYLLTIYDSERFKKLIDWPVICKKTEAKYRNNVKDYLTIIATENPDIGFPNILMSHLIHAGGSKFTIIMWKLSQVVLRKYITRETATNVTFAPQVRNKGNLTKKFLQGSNAKINCDILNLHQNLSQMENRTKSILEKEKEMLTKIIVEIFEKEQLIENLSHAAPVHPSIKKRLRDINDGEVIKMWKININKGLNKIQKKNVILKDTKQISYKANNIVLCNSTDTKTINANQLQKINDLEISELFPPDMQCLLFQLYRDEKMILNHFIVLFEFLLLQLYQQLNLSKLEDFSECSLQIEASCKDLKSALNIIQTYLTDITKTISETRDVLSEKNIIQIHNDTMLPMVNNMLITLSPLIKINTNQSEEENDLRKRLQFTPVEAAHKSLFSRYERLKESHTSRGTKLRGNSLVSRINFDETIASTSSEKPSLHITTSSKKSLSCFKQAEKYSRLFSTRMKRSNRAVNSSILSIPCTSKANSTTIANNIEEIHDISELSLNISSKSLCNISIEVTTPEKLTVRQNKSENTSETEDVINDFPDKANMLNMCETIKIETENNYDNNFTKTEQSHQRRRSIGDLVERYKKLLETRNRTPSPKISHVNCEYK